MIVVMSLWRNDSVRNLRERAKHLLAKTSAHHHVTFLWAVGDCDPLDTTYADLCAIADEFMHTRTIVITRVDTGITGEDVDTRRTRGSVSASAMFSALAHYYPEAEFACLHESDLRSSGDVLDRLLRTATSDTPHAVVAGWPVITLERGPQFYDTWAYRYPGGDYFTAHAPRPRVPFYVRGLGSVWLAPAALVRSRVIERLAIRELCEQWWYEGVPMVCDPRITIEQPVELWTAS